MHTYKRARKHTRARFP